jgi:hypothetical protein
MLKRPKTSKLAELCLRAGNERFFSWLHIVAHVRRSRRKVEFPFCWRPSPFLTCLVGRTRTLSSEGSELTWNPAAGSNELWRGARFARSGIVTGSIPFVFRLGCIARRELYLAGHYFGALLVHSPIAIS